MRFALVLVWLAVALTLLLPLVPRRRQRAHPHRRELVKDPVCSTYIVRGRAVEQTDGGIRRYFCSRECARRFALQLRARG